MLAFNLRKWWRRRRQRQQECSSSGGGNISSSVSIGIRAEHKAVPMAEAADKAAGDDGRGTAAAEEAAAGGVDRDADRAGPSIRGEEELDSPACPSGRSEAMASERLAWLADHPDTAYSTAQGGGHVSDLGGGAEGLTSCCYSGVMPQVDFAASLAVSLGLPIPFGSVGKVDPSWWRMAAAEEREEEEELREGREGAEEEGEKKGWMYGYERVLRLNAWQVRFLRE